MSSIYLLLSPNCNLSCKYCFQTDNVAETPGKQYHAQPAAKATVAIIDRFAEFCGENDITHVEFFGGEPLLYRDLFRTAVEIIASRVPNITMGAVTNGTMIDEGIMGLIERHDIAILLSLDGREDRHNEMRGGFDRISPWFPRLSNLKAVTVALQAAIIPGLSENVRFVWRQGLKNVYLNIIENYGWYQDVDAQLFEAEYESLLRSMLRGEGVLSCALQFAQQLRETEFKQGCGITRSGLACDWRGRLFPCHRAVELGPQFAIGDIFQGVDNTTQKTLRQRIDNEAFQSPSSKRYPLTSFCPVGTYQKHRNFSGDWSQPFCNMIELKAKLVAKYFREIQEWMEQETHLRVVLHDEVVA